MRVHNQPEVGDDVFDFLALVEGQAAVYFIRYSPLAEGFLEEARLGIGAVEDGEVGEAVALRRRHPTDGRGDGVGFLVIGVERQDAELAAHLLLGIDGLRNLFLILIYQTVRRIYDVLRGAVVLLELEDATARILVAELQDIVDVRPPERVDTLRIVAHDADTAARFAKFLDNQMLGEVCILILVHQDILEALAIFRQHVGMVAEEDVCLEEQIVEVHGPRLQAAVLVARVNVPEQGDLGMDIALHQLLVLLVSLAGDERVLRVGDSALHHARTVGLVVELHLLDDCFQEVFGIGGVIDREVRRETDAFSLDAEDTGENRVKRPHPELVGNGSARNRSNALLHLPRRLVGERQRQDSPRFVALFQEIRDFVGQDAGFPRTCASDNQGRSLAVGYCLALAVVELFQEVCHDVRKIFSGQRYKKTDCYFSI